MFFLWFELEWFVGSCHQIILFADKHLNPSRSVFQGSTQRCRSPAWNLEGSSGCCWRVDLYHLTMLTAICANSPFSKIVHLTLNRERYTFKERPQILLTFETFDQSDEETWPDWKKDLPTYLPIYLLTYLHYNPQVTARNHQITYLPTYLREHPKGAIIGICDIWDTDYNRAKISSVMDTFANNFAQPHTK